LTTQIGSVGVLAQYEASQLWTQIRSWQAKPSPQESPEQPQTATLFSMMHSGRVGSLQVSGKQTEGDVVVQAPLTHSEPSPQVLATHWQTGLPFCTVQAGVLFEQGLGLQTLSSSSSPLMQPDATNADMAINSGASLQE